jgi:hypothetical protein
MTEKTEVFGEKPVPAPFRAPHTRSEPESNPGLRDERPASNLLSHDNNKIHKVN